MADYPCLSAYQAGVLLRVWATPNAAKTATEGLREGRLALRVKAPPVEGKANEEVRRWAAKTFGVRPSRISLLRGERSREKDLLLEGLKPDAAAIILTGLLERKT